LKILVTGAAGFIGHGVCLSLLKQGVEVAGVDNLNAYYSVSLKEDRLRQLTGQPGFTFAKIDLEDRGATEALFNDVKPNVVIHLAAQAGVRYSLENPHAYAQSNLTGFLNILEGCRHHRVAHLVYASSSSVYGANEKLPFTVSDNVDHPLSLYAATKKANELMAHTYSHLYAIPTTGLRFFTVYGPWGRPDMALFKFTDAIVSGRPIEIYNFGKMQRDFTYIDDIVEGVIRCSERPPVSNAAWSGLAPDPSTSRAPYCVHNIGNNNPVELMYLVSLLEKELGRKAEKIMLPIQAGDVPATFADIDDLSAKTGFRPSTSIEDGVAKFVAWYRAYYNVA
jgi:UDP-glucuronate 4-epimerase